MKLEPYPEYRDSGLPWLGEIPAHWDVSSLRRLAQVQLSNVDKHTLEGETPIRLCNYTDVYYRDYITSDIEFMQASASPCEIDKFGLREGDVLITKDSESWTDIAVPACVEKDLPGVICGYHLAQIRPRSGTLKGAYLFRAFQSEPIAYQFRIAANGVTRYGLSSDGIASGLFLLPSVTEQDVIVHYLNRAARIISRLISAKQHLIELLNEQKQAIIHNAVTRGLDPEVPMKPTGLDWLPEVPEHWELRRLKSISNFITSGSRGWAEFYSDEGPIFLRIGNLSTTSIDLKLDDLQYVTPPKGVEGERTRVRPNDLLISITALLGAVGIVPDTVKDAYVNQHTALVRLQQDAVVHRWVAYCLHSDIGRFQFGTLTNGGTKEGLTLGDVGGLWILYPSLEDQRAITQYLDDVTEDVEKAIQRARWEIELIREYRTRLISDVVTGKLDVRGAELPEAGGEDEGVGTGLDGLESNATVGSIEVEEAQNATLRHQ